MKSKTMIIVVIVAILAIGGGAFFLLTNNNEDNNEVVTDSSVSNNQSEQQSSLEGNSLVQKVLDTVKENTPTIEDTRIIDENSDSNNLIGKKGEYQYAGAFYDSRTNYSPVDDNFDSINISEDDYGTTAGGSIEVFANSSDANKRGELLEGFQTGLIQAGAYKVVDNVVLRVSEEYTASQQEEMLSLMENAL